MDIIYKVGDMFESPSSILAHGCNSHGVMRSGVAKTMVERHYTAFSAYRTSFEDTGLYVGEVVFAGSTDRNTNQFKLIANCITQKDYGRDPNVVYVSYEGIRAAVKAINEYVRAYVVGREDQIHYENGLPTVTFPLIGAGLANGEWGYISDIIMEESKDIQPVVYIQTEEEKDKAIRASALFQISKLGQEIDLYNNGFDAVCVRDTGYEEYLTVGKKYRAVLWPEVPEGFLRIIDDKREHVLYPHHIFITIDEPVKKEESDGPEASPT